MSAASAAAASNGIAAPFVDCVSSSEEKYRAKEGGVCALSLEVSGEEVWIGGVVICKKERLEGCPKVIVAVSSDLKRGSQPVKVSEDSDQVCRVIEVEEEAVEEVGSCESGALEQRNSQSVQSIEYVQEEDAIKHVKSSQSVRSVQSGRSSQGSSVPRRLFQIS